MSITIELVDSFPVINSKINKAIAEEMNKRISKRISKGREIFKKLIFGWVMEQQEIQSLMAQGVPGSLNAAFGLTHPNVSVIASSVAEATSVNFTKISKKLSGGIEFNFQSNDFANLLGLPEGHLVTEMGADLHWLDWLLTKGDTVIIKGYTYKPSTEGRSRGGTMELGGFFRVDPKYSGKQDNNFITRAFEGRDKQLSKILYSFLR